jgi:hypothetical protein
MINNINGLATLNRQPFLLELGGMKFGVFDLEGFIDLLIYRVWA